MLVPMKPSESPGKQCARWADYGEVAALRASAASQADLAVTSGGGSGPHSTPSGNLRVLAAAAAAAAAAVAA